MTKHYCPECMQEREFNYSALCEDCYFKKCCGEIENPFLDKPKYKWKHPFEE